MDVMDVMPLLGRTELCARLSEDERRTIARLGEVGLAEASSTLMREGEPGSALVLLIEGEVVVQKAAAAGGQRELARLGPGAVLGEVALLEPVPRTATVRAATPIRFFQVQRERFQQELDAATPAATKLAVALARVLAQRQRVMNEKLVELAARLEERQSGDGDLLDDLVIELET